MKLQMGSQYQKERRQIRLQVFSVLRDLPKRHSTRLQKMSQTFLRRTTTMELFKKQNILRKKPFDPYLREIQHKRA